MAEFSKFRSSLGGFNRADVSDYIEALCTEHQKNLRKYKDEAAQTTKALEAAKQENTQLTQELADAREYADLLNQDLDEIKQTLQAQTEAAEALQQQLAEKEAALQAALDAAEPEEAGAESQDYTAMELEAYRRAEATERLAAERAQRIRRQLSDLLDGVSARYEDAGQEIQVLTEDIRTNLKRLEDTLSDLNLIFDETNGCFELLNLDDTENTVPV